MREGQSSLPALSDRPWLEPARLDEGSDGKALVIVFAGAGGLPPRTRLLVPLRREVVPQRPSPAPGRSIIRHAPWLLVPIATLAAWLALAEQAPAPSARPASVEINLPPLPPARLPAAPPAASAPAPVAATPDPPAPPMAAQPPQEKPAQPLAIDTLPAAEAAVRTAIATGVAQPWAEAGFEGYAVAGPSQIVGDAACRNIALWVEPRGGKAQAIDSRWCLMDSATWARQREAAPVDLLPPALKTAN